MELQTNLQTLLVTGGAGFIGSNFVLGAVAAGFRVLNLDLLTYAGNLENLHSLADHPRHTFFHGSIADRELLSRLFADERPGAVVNFAAESHVDRSIVGPKAFVDTNIVGTFHLLESTLAYWRSLPSARAESFRFLHVSTDEVYGSLADDEPGFRETTPFRPNSPYSASKAASDHLVRAWQHTYSLPVLTTHCSNNYGPFQFPEKLIPLMIHNALRGLPLPVYGDGQNVRDWLYVDDHCRAIADVLQRGRVGETYNIGGLSERRNLDLVHALCTILDELHPMGAPHRRLITFVADRPGHDRRYSIDCSKLQAEVGWSPRESLESGLRKTVQWYLDHSTWVEHVTSGAYRDWVSLQYADRPRQGSLA